MASRPGSAGFSSMRTREPAQDWQALPVDAKPESPRTRPSSAVSTRSSKASGSRSSSRTRNPNLPFSSERLAFSDGCVVFGANLCAGNRPSTPPVTPVRGKRYDMVTTELLEATHDIDAFEQRFPTLPGDAEEREERAAMNREAALRLLIPLLDTNCDGFVDRAEMRRALPHAADDEITRAMKSCDLDGDGFVAADEWLAYILGEQQWCDDAKFVEEVGHLCVVLEAPFKAAVAAAFAAADQDGSGLLDIFEASVVLGHHAREEGHTRVQQIIHDFDTDRNGQIDFAEVHACAQPARNSRERRVIPANTPFSHPSAPTFAQE